MVPLGLLRNMYNFKFYGLASSINTGVCCSNTEITINPLNSVFNLCMEGIHAAGKILEGSKISLHLWSHYNIGHVSL